MGYEVLWEPRGVVKRLFGHVTDDDLIRLSTAVWADGRFVDLDYMIVDLRDCRGHTVSDPMMIEIAAIDEAGLAAQKTASGMPNVAVIADDHAFSALAGEYASHMAAGISLGVFNCLEAARIWLGASFLERNSFSRQPLL